MVAVSALLFLSLQSQDSAPVKLTADEDHKRLMALLHIDAIRGGADGMNPKAANYQNTDEAKAAASYTKLPNPLVFNNGKPVKNARDWNARRKELFEDFDREIYGRFPKQKFAVKWEVTSTTEDKLGDVPVVKKALIGHVDNSSYPQTKVDIQLNLTMPKESKGKMPVILEYGFGGNFRPRNPNPNAPLPKSWQQKVVERGWAAAVIVPTSYQADNGAGLTQGIIGLANKGQPRKVDDWGTLKAWAWGASRAIDYFATEPTLDAKQVGIEGLSRYGKAALVTMAYEPRMAIALVGSSGQGGAKLSRRDFGEKVENVAGTGEYHWMAGNYIKYAGPLTPNDLPVDSHELIALCAPRPVFVGCGSPKVEGFWVDDTGMFTSTALASPVYELLRKKGLGTMEMPPMETALVAGELAFRQHSGGHTNEPNWDTFLDFASRYLRVK